MKPVPAPVDFRYLMEQVWGEPRDLRLSADAMVSRRDERVRSIVRFAFEHVPWYERVMRDRGLTPEDFRTARDLSRLPVVGHEDLASDPTAFLPRGVEMRDLLELRTSGSTMIPRRIYHDPEGMVAGWAAKLRERAVRERLVGRARRTALLSIEGNPSRVRERFRVIAPAVWKLIPEERQFSEVEDTPRLIEALGEWHPDHLTGYGSAIGRLFRHLSETGASMPLPDVVTFSANAMPASERRIIEEEHGLPVLGIYNATEAFSIGFECGQGDGYHVNEDASFVRVADPEGNDAEPGVPGSIILSNLVNRGTVLLNYRLGDIGAALDGDCSCGRSLPRIRLLEGRDGYWIQRAGRPPIYQYRLYLALTAAGIERWQVVQTGLESFTVRVIPEPGQDRPSMESAIRSAITGLVGTDLDISIEYPTELERTPSGKVLYCISR
jgi:phenylacetate-CoA ligase